MSGLGLWCRLFAVGVLVIPCQSAHAARYSNSAREWANADVTGVVTDSANRAARFRGAGERRELHRRRRRDHDDEYVRRLHRSQPRAGSLLAQRPHDRIPRREDAIHHCVRRHRRAGAQRRAVPDRTESPGHADHECAHRDVGFENRRPNLQAEHVSQRAGGDDVADHSGLDRRVPPAPPRARYTSAASTPSTRSTWMACRCLPASPGR